MIDSTNTSFCRKVWFGRKHDPMLVNQHWGIQVITGAALTIRYYACSCGKVWRTQEYGHWPLPEEQR